MGPLEVILSNSPVKARPPRVAQDHDLTTFENLQGERLCNFSGQAVLIIITVKKGFLVFRGKLLRACLWPLVLSLGITEKNLAPSSFHPPFKYLYPLIKQKLLNLHQNTKTLDVTCYVDLNNCLSRNSDIQTCPIFYQVREVGFVKGHQSCYTEIALFLMMIFK